MEPWIVDANADPDIALRVRQTGREVAAVGLYLWDMIGRPEPFDVAEHLIRFHTGWEAGPYLGGVGDDVILGSAIHLRGGEGNDVIFQDGWSLALLGNEGDDFLAGWTDNNVVAGGSGNDTLLGGYGDDTLAGGSGSNVLIGGFGNDYLDASSASAWRGWEWDAASDGWIEAKRLAHDALYGGAGQDTLIGSYGSDSLYGGDDSDLLRGQDGDDYLNGGFGRDTLRGRQRRRHALGRRPGRYARRRSRQRPVWTAARAMMR